MYFKLDAHKMILTVTADEIRFEHSSTGPGFVGRSAVYVISRNVVAERSLCLRRHRCAVAVWAAVAHFICIRVSKKRKYG